jgi:hypothetical protein
VKSTLRYAAITLNGVAGNIRALFKVYRATERYWHRMLCSRKLGRTSHDVGHLQPDQEEDTVTATQAAPPLPGAASTRSVLKSTAEEPGAGNLHAGLGAPSDREQQFRLIPSGLRSD